MGKNLYRNRYDLLTEIAGESIENILNPIEDLLNPIEDIDWNQISKEVETRTAAECEQQWMVVQHPKINKEPFSKAELDHLEKIVLQVGEHDWQSVARLHGVMLFIF